VAIYETKVTPTESHDQILNYTWKCI